MKVQSEQRAEGTSAAWGEGFVKMATGWWRGFSPVSGRLRSSDAVRVQMRAQECVPSTWGEELGGQQKLSGERRGIAQTWLKGGLL